jgi:hypothetical protein
MLLCLAIPVLRGAARVFGKCARTDPTRELEPGGLSKRGLRPAAAWFQDRLEVHFLYHRSYQFSIS